MEDDDGDGGRVTINRPERRNSMSYGVMQGLRDAVAAAKSDNALRAVVLTGPRDKAVCAGADFGGNADTAGSPAPHARGGFPDAVLPQRAVRCLPTTPRSRYLA